MGQRLRKIAEVLAGGTKLLAEETKVVGVGEHAFEDQVGLLDAAGACKAFDIPEGAGGEGALVTLETVGIAIAEDQTIIGQLVANGVEAWTKWPTSRSKNSDQISSWMSLRTCRQCSKGAESERFSASRKARSMATQHISRE